MGIALVVGLGLLAGASLCAQEPVGRPSSRDAVELLTQQASIAEQAARLRSDQLARAEQLEQQGAVPASAVTVARLDLLGARVVLLDIRQRLSLAQGEGPVRAAALAAERIALATERVAVREQQLEQVQAQANAGLVDPATVAEHTLAVLQARLELIDAQRVKTDIDRAARERELAIARLDRAIARARQDIAAREAALAEVQTLFESGRCDAEAVQRAHDSIDESTLRSLELRTQRVRMDRGGGFGLAVDLLAERVAILERQVASRRDRVAQVRALFESGHVPRAEVGAADRDLHEAELRLVDLRDELELMRAR